MKEFAQLELNEQLMQAVSAMGYEEPTPIQEQVIPLMMAGEDVFAQSQTGSGKTAAFALPILNTISPNQGYIQCLVLTPTRELAMQGASAFHDFGKGGNFSVLPVYGGQAYARQITRLQKGVDVVVGTPGRLIDLMKKEVLDLSHVQVVVVDEADEMLSMGFIDDIKAILDATPNSRQTALFSATLPEAIRQLGSRYMRKPHSIQIEDKHMTVDTIEQRYYVVDRKQKFSALTHLFEMENIERALVFASTKISTEQLSSTLSARGYQAEVINGNLDQDARIRVLNRFKQNQIQVLVATDVAARGLDIEDVSHVFNYDLPREAEGYVHRIGRTGRAGKTGIAITLVTPKELWFLKRIEKFTKQEMTKCEIPSAEDILKKREADLLERMRIWLKRDRCAKEKELINVLIEEGHDPLEIAAVAVKMARADEKQRPVESFSATTEITHRKSSKKPRSNIHPSNEEGMVRIMVSSGRRDGINPSEIVGSIARFSNIPGRSIGKILIRDNHSLVDIDARYVDQVLAKTGQIKMKKDSVTFKRA
ncbi:MAG TPA: RNA helicase [Anaerolineaceae bacterium]|nr:RNA helicase [Anaerolineaceae bacterium]